MRNHHLFPGTACCWAAALLVCASLGIVMQARADEDEPVPATSAGPALPEYFDHLDLTPTQEVRIIAILEECDEKIANHEAQIRRLHGKPFVTSIIIAHARAIKKLRGLRQTEVETVLDDNQRAKLEELRQQAEPPGGGE
jgi:Spy/CpxP family protein refolding chaperone